MVDEQDREPLVDHLAQLAAERRGLAGVEAGGRLVEQQQLRLRREGSGDRHHLALTLCELTGKSVGEPVE